MSYQEFSRNVNRAVVLFGDTSKKAFFIGKYPYIISLNEEGIGLSVKLRNGDSFQLCESSWDQETKSFSGIEEFSEWIGLIEGCELRPYTEEAIMNYLRLPQ